MSKKHRHPGRQRSVFGWPIIVLGALLVSGAAFLVARQGGTSGGGGTSDGGTPQIAVDQEKIDYGYVNFGQTRSFKIAVTNDGDAPLRFRDRPYIQVLEGC